MSRPRTHRLAALLLVAGACAPTEEPPPHLVLVLVDQLRHDAVERWMPRTRELGEAGVVLDGMRSAAPWTYPSVVSAFSGLYPHQHGADGAPDASRRLSVFSDDVPLLHRLLADRYATAAFVTNPFLQTWNPFHRGFEHYEIDAFIGDQGARMGDAGSVWTEGMFADSVNAEVRAHFDARPVDEPEFTYVHYIDVHGPWDGAPFDARGADHRQTRPVAYATAARYVDERIAKLWDYFSERYPTPFLFVVTSDHGQELADDLALGRGQEYRHRKGTVHDFNTRIPCVVFPSPLVAGGRRLEGPVSNVDLAPTLLEAAGVSPPLELAGRSLWPALRGLGELDPDRAVYSLQTAFGRHNDCAVVGGRKLMRHFDPESGDVRARAVFDLVRDPREAEVVATEFGPEGARLDELAAPGPVAFPKLFESPSDELESKLQDLGYLGDE